MSMIVTVFVSEGIVMASDSRTTYNLAEKDVRTGNVTHRIGIHTNNSTLKTFLCPNGSGISVCGEASVDKKPITGFIEAFIREKISESTDVDELPKLLLEWFSKVKPMPKVIFTVAGYHREGNAAVQRVYKVFTERNETERIGTENQGATWDGETLPMTRLLQRAALKTPEGKYIDFPHADIAWNFFTLQDAVDFCNFSIKTTIGMMHFQSVPETVGEPVNILIIKPDGSHWLQKRELHA